MVLNQRACSLQYHLCGLIDFENYLFYNDNCFKNLKKYENKKEVFELSLLLIILFIYLFIC